MGKISCKIETLSITCPLKILARGTEEQIPMGSARTSWRECSHLTSMGGVCCLNKAKS